MAVKIIFNPPVGAAGGPGEITLVNSIPIGTRAGINLIPGTNITISGVDNAGQNTVDVTINGSSGGGGGTPIQTINSGTVTSPPFGPLWNFTDPTLPAFAWVNQGAATVVTTNQTLSMIVPTGGGRNWHHYEIATPGTPYTITVAVIITAVDSAGGFNNMAAGLTLRDSTTGKFEALTLSNVNAAPGLTPVSNGWTNDTTFSTTFNQSGMISPFGPVWIRLNDNGTNINTSFSADGINFSAYTSHGRTSFLANPDKIGIGADNENQGSDVSIMVLSWKQT